MRKLLVFNSTFFAAVLWLSACGSTETNARDTGSTGDMGKQTAAILMNFQDKDGNEYTCTPTYPNDIYAYDCVRDGTKDVYSCVLPKNYEDPSKPGDVFQWCKPKPEKYVPPCEDPLYPGDGRQGRQCWNPPYDYCSAMGFGVVRDTWFCSRDGSHCCRSPGELCFLCGWVEVDTIKTEGHYFCQIIDEHKYLPDTECDNLGARLQEYITGDKAGMDLKDPVCQQALYNMTHVKAICPGGSE